LQETKEKDGKVMEMSFDEKLEFGKQAELKIESYFKNMGYGVIRSYDYNGDGDKAPKMFFKDNELNLIIPDLDCSKNGKRIWVECKHYTLTPFNRTFGIHVHGIKIRHYNDYLKIQETTGNDVYLVIKEIEGNCFLFSKLEDLQTYPCLNKHKHNSNCLMYFNRDDFKKIEVIDERAT
jgi:hypothetical protein